jgi:hypothetical protein
MLYPFMLTVFVFFLGWCWIRLVLAGLARWDSVDAQQNLESLRREGYHGE